MVATVGDSHPGLADLADASLATVDCWRPACYERPTRRILGERGAASQDVTGIPLGTGRSYRHLHSSVGFVYACYVLRARRLCGLKFRRQLPITPFIVDFACVEKRLVVEIDGGYHDYVYENDQSRQ